MAQTVKNLPALWETQVRSLGGEDPLEKGMGTHFSILARRIPCTEELAGLQFMGSQRVSHDLTESSSSSQGIRLKGSAVLAEDDIASDS